MGNSDQSTLKYDVQSEADENKRDDPMTMAVDGSQNDWAFSQPSADKHQIGNSTT